MSYRHRMTGLYLFFLVLAGIVVSRAAYIQVGRDPRLERMASKQFRSRVLVRPRRGLIVDRQGEALAINVETPSLAANPRKLRNKKEAAWLISRALGLNAQTLLKRFREDREFIWVKRHLGEVGMHSLKRWKLVDREGEAVEGLLIVKEAQRVYPHGEVAAQLLGSVNIDTDGLEGVELWLNEQMRGEVVSLDAVRDALGRPTFIDASAARHIKDGQSIELTIDASLQYSVERELKQSLESTHARAGLVAVMNADTGEILALANQPSFNPNLRSEGVAEARRNRAVTDGYEPGSTLKAVLVASALSHGWKITDGVHAGEGSIKIQGRTISEAESHEKFGWIDLRKLLQVSSNVGSARLALQLGSEKYYKTLRDFGFGQKTGLGFPGELSGWLPSVNKPVQPLTLATTAFGQGLFATPLQVLRAYAVFANGGYLVVPRLLKDSPQKKVQVLKPEIAKSLAQALTSVTEGDQGTGKKAKVDGFLIAGKTGTAQVVDSKTKRYSNSRYIVSFAGFPFGLDAKSEQKLVVLTLLDSPRGVYYASETAAPLFKRVMEAAVARFSIPPTRALEQPRLAVIAPAPSPTGGSQTEEEEDQVVTSPAHFEVASSVIGTMPNLKGLTLREALKLLQAQGVEVQVFGRGLVNQQSPGAGTAIESGTRVKLDLSEME